MWADGDYDLLREISLDDVFLICCSARERRVIRKFVSDGLVELRGRVFKRATITQRGLDMLAQ